MALAKLLSVTPRALQSYETNGAPASRAEELASALGLDPSFFFRSEREAIAVEQGFFRARRRATAAQLASARAAAAIGVELYEWITDRFSLPQVQIPDLDHQDPETAASALRASWGRGEQSLPNLLQLSEAFGVRVMSLPTDADTVDAFSFWLNGSPYVFLSMAKTAERSRFDLAHELGHLVMHSRAQPDDGEDTAAGGQELEREADVFASALLMPRRQLLAHAGREPAVPQILQLRDHYRVSAMAMARRLHELERLTDWGYRQNCMELSQRGFRSAEPGGMEHERSRIFGTIFSVLREQGRLAQDVAADLGITVTELHGLTFGHVPVSVPGQGSSRARGLAHLRLVDAIADPGAAVSR